jgi:hypothetical protein
MPQVIPSGYDDNWNSLSGPGNTSLGNPADLGPWRGMAQQRGAKYEGRSDALYDWGVGKAGDIGSIGDEVTQRALNTGAQFNDAAVRDRRTYDENYVPAMLEQLNYARDYTTDARKAANRGGAMADVSMTFDAAADLAKRNLQSYGVNPAAGRFAGLDAGIATSRAKALAGAGTKSDRDTEMMGQQLLDNAIGRGAVLPGQAVNSAGVGIAANNQAVNTGLATAQTQKQLMEPSGWANLSDQQLRDWKDSLIQQTNLGLTQNRDVAQQQLAQQQMANQSSSGIGSLIGAGLGIAGSIFGGPLGGMAGSMLGKMAGSGMQFAEGGMVPDDEGMSFGDEDEIAVEDDALTSEVEGENMVPPEASPSGGAEVDDVTAQVSAGEFVVPKDVTAWYGEKFMQKLIEKARMEMTQRTAEPQMSAVPQAVAVAPPSFASEGARA